MKLPAPVPVLAAAAGAATFALARVVYAGPPSAAPADQAAPATDAGLAGGGGSGDLWSAFSGDGTTVYGDQGGGQLFPPSSPYDPGAPIPPGSPVAPPTMPPPTSPFASYGPKPAGAVGVQDAIGVPLYSVSSGVAKQITVSSTIHAWVGASKLYKPNATLRKVLSGGHAGSYVKANAGTFRSA
jgi:hypothetical protein